MTQSCCEKTTKHVLTRIEPAFLALKREIAELKAANAELEDMLAHESKMRSQSALERVRYSMDKLKAANERLEDEALFAREDAESWRRLATKRLLKLRALRSSNEWRTRS